MPATAGPFQDRYPTMDERFFEVRFGTMKMRMKPAAVKALRRASRGERIRLWFRTGAGTHGYTKRHSRPRDNRTDFHRRDAE